MEVATGIRKRKCPTKTRWDGVREDIKKIWILRDA